MSTFQTDNKAKESAIHKTNKRRSNNSIMVDYITAMEKSYNNAALYMCEKKNKACKSVFLTTYENVLSIYMDLTNSNGYITDCEFYNQYYELESFLKESKESNVSNSVYERIQTFEFKRNYNERFDDHIHDEFFDNFEWVFTREQQLFQVMEVFFQLDQTKESHLKLIDPIFRAAKSYTEDEYSWNQVSMQIKIITINHKAVKTFLDTPMSDIRAENKRIRYEEKEDMMIKEIEQEMIIEEWENRQYMKDRQDTKEIKHILTFEQFERELESLKTKLKSDLKSEIINELKSEGSDILHQI
jgi:hypothetical protein